MLRVAASSSSSGTSTSRARNASTPGPSGVGHGERARGRGPPPVGRGPPAGRRFHGRRASRFRSHDRGLPDPSLLRGDAHCTSHSVSPPTVRFVRSLELLHCSERSQWLRRLSAPLARSGVRQTPVRRPTVRLSLLPRIRRSWVDPSALGREGLRYRSARAARARIRSRSQTPPANSRATAVGPGSVLW